VLQLLLFDYERDDRRLLRPDDARLWAWLEAQPTWEGTPERLLWRMASAATEGAARDAVWARAEAAAKRKPARAAVVGWVMNRTQAARRSLAVLEVACAEHSDEERRRSACFTLLESDLDTLRWKEAEALWPQASLRLTATERPDWLGKVAVCAARAGAPEEAVRLWAQKDALDFAALGHLEELGKTSARPALIRYYETLQRERPSSTVPPTALARLRAMK
jgi:hypothetical protein